VKKPEQAFDGITKKSPDKDLVELAEELIEKKAADFNPEKFKDTYTVALKELIDAKLQKRPPKSIEETPPASNVINLMDALKRSVKGGAAAERGNGKSEGKKPAKAKAAAKKTAKRKAGKRAA
jgi:DNA end-binding protein Ku